jgi:hypothetical protein
VQVSGPSEFHGARTATRSAVPLENLDVQTCASHRHSCGQAVWTRADNCDIRHVVKYPIVERFPA